MLPMILRMAVFLLPVLWVGLTVVVIAACRVAARAEPSR
jgi:hypothetical protein